MEHIMTADARIISGCEVCGNPNPIPVLNLGKHPLCDDLVPLGDSRVCKEYPIEVLFCETCRTGHQRYQVPKQDLFPRTYHYRSRFTADVLNGMKSLVDSVEQRFGSLRGKLALDVGCNDGSLLSFFREKGGRTVGIEPTGAAADAKEAGHPVYSEFLSEEVADKLVAEHGQPDFIVFTNVFAHIEDLAAVVRSLRRLMSPTTVIVIENHYLGAVLDGNQFDTFYHEHPRTYSYSSFVHIARALGLGLAEVEFPARYGGNIRVFLAPGQEGAPVSDAVRDVLAREEAYRERFKQLAANVEIWRHRKKVEIAELVKQHGKLRAKAFPARAAILVKLLGLDDTMIEAVHEKPGSMKIAHYLPGTRIPIVSDDELMALPDKSKPLINMAWHISKEIRGYLAKTGYTGPIVDILSQEDFSQQ
jgi:SAM-dependent methyltransferase